MWTWSSTHGLICSVHQAVEAFADGVSIGAVLVDEPQQLLGLQQGSGNAAAEVRRRGGHRVADENQPWQGEPAVVPGLAAVGVEQRAAGKYRRDRPGAVGIGPVGQAGNGPARGGKGRLVPQLGQDRISNGPHEQDGEDAVFVHEDDRLVAVQVCLPRDRVRQRAGFGAGRSWYWRST